MRRAGIDDEIRGNFLTCLARSKCYARVETQREVERTIVGVFLFVATDASESIEFEVSDWGRDEKKSCVEKGDLRV